MTDDLVERLRDMHVPNVWEAADRIEAQDAEMKMVMEINERLLAALREIADQAVQDIPSIIKTFMMLEVARAALAGEKKDD